MHRCGSAQGGAGPGEEVDAGGHGGGAGEDAAIDGEFFVKREKSRDDDEEDYGAGAVEMDKQGEQERAGNNASWALAHRAQDGMNQRGHHAGIGEDAEEEDGEDEHGDDWGNALNAADDEAGGVEAEAGSKRGEDGDEDERGQRREQAGEDCRKDRENGECSPKGHALDGLFPARCGLEWASIRCAGLSVY